MFGFLQESTANVEEWKKQLAAYKEENARLKKRVAESDKGGDGRDSHMVGQLTDQIERIRLDNQQKDQEIKRLVAQTQVWRKE